jgi:hypothetical protein
MSDHELIGDFPKSFESFKELNECFYDTMRTTGDKNKGKELIKALSDENILSYLELRQHLHTETVRELMLELLARLAKKELDTGK